jgi:hypothetical protein
MAGDPAVGEHRASQALDAVIRRERGWLNLAVLRLYTHPGLRYVFPAFLEQVYHGMHTATALMEAALARSVALAPHCPVANRLVDYWTDHIRAEAGHDEWLLHDMRRLRIDADRVVASAPDPDVAELIGTLHFWVLHTHPIAALAYFYIAERSVPNQRMVDRIAESAGVRSEGLRTFHRHAVIDLAHGRELEELLDSLPLTVDHKALLTLSATTTLRQLSRHIQKLLDLADESLAAARC